MTDTVLVTGASGFLGAHVVLALLRAGFRVRGTVRDVARATERFARFDLPDRGRLTFVPADLAHDGGWEEAATGCAFVVHTASPVPSGPVADEDAVIAPARDGTRRVLRAAAVAGARRVVVTSSTAAVLWGHARDGTKTYDERDWTDLDAAGVGAYERSKTLAERAAWELAGEHGLELVAILPGAILGPLLDGDFSVSGQIVKALLARELPGVPDLGFALVDVRDVAAMHVAALTAPAAAGNRFVVAGPHVPMAEVAAILARHYASRGFRVPQRRLPSFAIRLMALWDATASLTAGELGKRQDVSSERAREVLGFEPRATEEMVLAMAESMLAHAVIAPP